MRVVGRHVGVAGLLLCLAAPGVQGQSAPDETWNPFKLSPDRPTPRRAQPPPEPASVQRGSRFEANNRPVESSDLAPVMAPDTSGLPLDLWRGFDMAALEQLLAGLDLPPRSPALQQLWRRMLLSSATPPSGVPDADHFLALRLEALYRSGLLSDMAEVLDKNPPSPLLQVLRARKDIGTGSREAGCEAVKAIAAPRSGLPGRLKGEAQLLAGYCAAKAGDAATAGLAANIAREEGVAADLALTVLSSLDSGTRPRLALPARILLLDYRFLELMGPVDGAPLVQKAEPALLVVLAGPTAGDVQLQTAAAEAALRLNALTPDAVAEVYRRQPEPTARARPAQSERVDPLLRRAQLFRAVEITQAPELKAQLVRALLDDARRAGVHVQTARMLAPLVAQLWPSPDSGALAEPIVEIALAAGDFDLARRWAETAANLQHWLALIDIADPQGRGAGQSGLRYAGELAARGRFRPEALHRLAAVLDALDLEVPIGLWEAAGRMPQPVTGYLPETGVLADLAQSAQRKDAGRTILLVMRAFGSNGAEGANLLALGDAVRAFKQAGLEADARRLAVEALFAVWPRASGR